MQKETDIFRKSVLPNQLKPVFSCKKCHLSSEGGFPVIPRGNISSYLTLVGEAPGKNEEEQNCTFVGPAGELLEKMLNVINLSLDKDFFCINAVLCRPRPPIGSARENGTPTIEDIKECKDNFKSLIIAQRPKLIVLAGKSALQSFIGPVGRISDYVGKFIPAGENQHELSVPGYVIYHPSFLLRQPTAEKDFGLHLYRLRDYLFEHILT